MTSAFQMETVYERLENRVKVEALSIGTGNGSQMVKRAESGYEKTCHLASAVSRSSVNTASTNFHHESTSFAPQERLLVSARMF